MLGSWAGFPHGISTWKTEDRAAHERPLAFLHATRALAQDVDLVGWHPFYQTDPAKLPGYADDVRALEAWLKEAGFRGRSMATEWNYSALYPPMPAENAQRAWCGDFRATEMEKAKYVAQVFARHTGLGIESFFCEMYFRQFGVLDLSLLRRSFDADPISPLQPQAAYYVTRNLATMLDGLEPASFAYRVTPAPAGLEAFPLAAPPDRALVLWLGGRAQDRSPPTPVDVSFPFASSRAVAYDPIKGVKQDLVLTASDGRTLVKGLLIHDSPVIVRCTPP